MSLMLTTLSFLFSFISNFGDTYAAPTKQLCRPEQRDVLLEFKNEFETDVPCFGIILDPFLLKENISYFQPKSVSWRYNRDCCDWDGITCDPKSREVIKLDLSYSCLHGRFHSNTSLLKLKNLPFLNTISLSYNSLSGEVLSSIGNLSHLTFLDLSNNVFSGEITLSIGNLSHLSFLDLSNNLFSGEIPLSIGNLSHLTSLNLSNNHFSGGIPLSIGNLSHLTFLDFSNNLFSGGMPFSVRNLSRLTSLDLSDNGFNGEISSLTENLPHLTTLRLSVNNFDGKIPFSIGKLSLLTTLDLSHNYFDGEIPSSMVNLSHLTSLSFFENKLVGKIPSFIGGLNQLTSLSFSGNTMSGNFPIALLNLTKLSSLDISFNQFTGILPTNINLLSHLEYFDASVNSFFGTPPSALFAVPSLTEIYLDDNIFNGTLEIVNVSSSSKLDVLHLGNNNLRGPFPRSISKLVNLDTLDISDFNIQGPVDFSIFSHIKGLRQLYMSHSNTTTTIDLNAVLSLHLKSISRLVLSGNHVSTTNKSSVANQRVQYLQELYLSDCGITEFPEILRSQQHGMIHLDISNNKIKGQVPAWLWKLVYHVDLSNNTFTGFERPTKLALWKPLMTYLLASNNNFTGKIPSFICTLHSLDTLDLSNNSFNGPIPRCIGNLSRLILRRNRLNGGLPENIYGKLILLDVGHNQLVGKLPRSLIHSPTLEVFNVETNMINDLFPFWLSPLQNLQILVLRSNAFHGSIQKTRFAKLRIMDISQNNFSGTLPSDFFASWTAMTTLDKNEEEDEMYMGSGYYHDSMVLMSKGVAMELVRILKIYTALDFSGNKLEGEIPDSIGLLKELRVLNLSNNALLKDKYRLYSLDIVP